MHHEPTEIEDCPRSHAGGVEAARNDTGGRHDDMHSRLGEADDPAGPP